MTGPATQPYRIGFAAHNAFVWAWIKRNSFGLHRVWILLALAGGTTIFYAAASVKDDIEHKMPLGLLIGGSLLGSLIVWVIAVYVLWPLLTWVWQMLSFAAGPAHRPAQSVRLTSDGIEKTMDGASHLFTWDRSQDAAVKGRTLLLFTGRNSAMIIPRRAFDTREDAQAFAHAAAARIGPCKPAKNPEDNF